MSNPNNFPAKVDAERVSIFGGSMGGTGTNFIAMRNGDVFASGFADKGISSWALNKKHNTWAENIWAKCGIPEKNLRHWKVNTYTMFWIFQKWQQSNLKWKPHLWIYSMELPTVLSHLTILLTISNLWKKANIPFVAHGICMDTMPGSKIPDQWTGKNPKRRDLPSLR